jgi:YD repeat-containing protein
MTMAQDPLFVQDEVPINDEIARRAGVRSMTGYTTQVVGGSPSADSFRSYYLEYNGTGTRIRHEKFDNDAKVARRWMYDAQGRLSQEITYDAKGDIEYWFDIASDGQDWTQKRMYYPPDRLHYRIAADRDASGRLLQTTYYDPAGQSTRSDSYSYDSLGLLVRVAVGHMGERVYEYDQRQNLKRRSNNLPGMSAYGDVHEFGYDDRDLVVRMDHLHFSVTTFAFTS